MSNSKEATSRELKLNELATALKMPFSKVKYYSDRGFLPYSRSEKIRHFNLGEVSKQLSLINRYKSEGYKNCCIKLKLEQQGKLYDRVL